jgi:hypothetical protein
MQPEGLDSYRREVRVMMLAWLEGGGCYLS